MTVQELIDRLNGIEDKTKEVIEGEYRNSVDVFEVDKHIYSGGLEDESKY